MKSTSNALPVSSPIVRPFASLSTPLKAMNNIMKFLKLIAATLLVASSVNLALAQEATIRKNLAERLPAFSKIDEVSKTPMAGLFEVRINDSDVFYTDAEGNFLIQGVLLDTKAKRNLTQERTDKLSAIDFGALRNRS